MTPATIPVPLLTLNLPYPPALNHLYRHVGNRVLISREGRQYRDVVGGIVLVSRASLHLTCRLAIEIDAYPPDRRARDLDGLQKALLDALQKALVYENDSQIDVMTVRRMPVVAGGRMVVRLHKIEGE